MVFLDAYCAGSTAALFWSALAKRRTRATSIFAAAVLCRVVVVCGSQGSRDAVFELRARWRMDDCLCAAFLWAQRSTGGSAMSQKVWLFAGSLKYPRRTTKSRRPLAACSGRLRDWFCTASLGFDASKTRTRFNLSLTCRRYFELARPCKKALGCESWHVRSHCL